MVTSDFKTLAQISKLELVLQALIRRDNCAILLTGGDAGDIEAVIYFKGVNVSDGVGLTIFGALQAASLPLRGLAAGDLDKKLDEALEESNNEN